MATTYKQGDPVQIVDREATADDVKSGLFYNYFRGLTGTVQKVFPTEAAVVIDQTSLTEPVLARHLDVQEHMKTRWLDGLSEEARSRLNEAERDFRLRYTLLVGLTDLTAPGTHSTPAERAATAGPAPAAPVFPVPTATPVAPARVVEEAALEEAPLEEELPRRLSAEDLEAAEEAELRRRQTQEAR